MITWIICTTVLFVVLTIAFSLWGELTDLFLGLLFFYGLFGVTPTFVFKHSEDSNLINANSISFIVNDLPYSRIITIPAEGNDSLKLLAPSVELPITLVYDKIADVERIDSLDFKFQYTKHLNIWGHKIYRDIELVLGTN